MGLASTTQAPSFSAHDMCAWLQRPQITYLNLKYRVGVFFWSLHIFHSSLLATVLEAAEDIKNKQ